MTALSLLAQEQIQTGEFLNRLNPNDLMAIVIVGIVFTTILAIVVTVSVTRTVRVTLVAGANARMAEKLAAQGYTAEQVERIVVANSRTFRLPSLCRKRPRGWQTPAHGYPQVPGKPA